MKTEKAGARDGVTAGPDQQRSKTKKYYKGEIYMWLPDTVTWAVRRGDIQTLHQLVAKDPGLSKLQASEGSFTLLHKCADNDSPDIIPVVDLLLSNGADVNARDYTSCGVTPLHMACSAHGNIPRNVAVAERLLAAGADPNAQTLTRDDIALYRENHQLSFTGLAPLHFALRQEQSDLIGLLISRGASPVLHTCEQNYGSPIDSARRGDWLRHLPEMLKAPFKFPHTLTLKLKTLKEEPPSTFLCKYRFLDPRTTPINENMAELCARLPGTEIEEIESPGFEQEQTLSPKIDVQIAADGLPCNLDIEVRAAGPEKLMQHGFYAHKPIKYTETWIRVSPVNFQRGVRYEFPNYMFRKVGDEMLTNYCFSIIISGY